MGRVKGPIVKKVPILDFKGQIFPILTTLVSRITFYVQDN